MNINRVKLRGFLGIKKGLGLDEVELDISDLAGLIAISGKTGAGKTTLIENLQPYAQLVSRPQVALKNHVFLRDSIKELDFEHEGNFYRTVVKIDAQSGRSEGYVYVQDQSLVNGKISEYNNWVNNTFGSPNLFFNSAFAAQNSAKISSLRPAELKALFTEFLGDRLAQLVRYENGAKSAITHWTVQQNTIAGRLQALSNIPAELEQATGNVVASKKKAQVLKLELAHWDKVIAEAKEKMKHLDSLVEANNRAKIEKEACLEKLRSANTEKNDLQKRLESVRSDFIRKVSFLENKIDSNKQFLDANAGDIESAEHRIRNHEQAITGLEEKRISLQSNDIPALRKKLESLEGALDESRKAEAKTKSDRDTSAAERQAEIRRLEVEISDLESHIRLMIESPSIATLRAKIESAAQQMKLLDKRGTDLSCSCGETFDCNSQNCEFIQSALVARSNWNALNEKKNKLEKDRDNKIELDEKALADLRFKLNSRLGANAADIDNASVLLDAIESEQMGIEAKIKDTRSTIAKAETDVRAIEDEIEARRKGIAEDKDKAGQAVKIAIVKNEVKIQTEDLERIRKERDVKVSEAQAALDEKKDAAFKLQLKCDQILYDELLDGKVVSAKDEYESASSTRAKIAEKLAIEKALQANLEQKIASLKESKDTYDTYQEQSRTIVNEISNWKYIKDACGANGLRALEINSVAPAIAADANKLLEQALGSWAMVDFNTVDEEGREVLEPRVIDPDGDSVLIANRSGGQQVWALKALRLAMTLISKENSGKNYLTAYADEDDAGLDVETAQAYTKLYKVFMPTGGFEKCLFISHKPECVALADHVIRVNGGGIYIER